MPHSTQKAKLVVWIPILVTIASLIFGAFQYFDKRAQEETLKNLELKIKEAEIREKQADISIHYVVTDFQTIKAWSSQQATFDEEGLLNWLRFLEKVLPFETSLHIWGNTVYAEIMSYYVEDTTNHYLTFLLLRNAGKSNAKNIHIGFDAIDIGSDREQEHSLDLNRLEPGHGVMVPIEHYDILTNKYFGTWLRPAIRLTYFDSFLEENKELTVRGKAVNAQILAPTTGLSECIY